MASDTVTGSGWGISGPMPGASLFQREWNRDDAQTAQDWSQAAAQHQMDFQLNMSNTAHRRAVDDLKGAGLNPMLAMGGVGASTPQGAGFAGQKANSNAMVGGAANRNYTMQTAAQIRNLDADSNLKNAQAQEVAPTAGVQRELTAHSSAEIRQKINESKERVEFLLQEQVRSTASAENLQQQTANLRKLIPNLQETLQLLKTQTGEGQQRIRANLPGLEADVKRLQAIFMELEKPGRQQTGDFQASGAGQVLKSIGNALRELNPILPSTTHHSR